MLDMTEDDAMLVFLLNRTSNGEVKWRGDAEGLHSTRPVLFHLPNGASCEVEISLVPKVYYAPVAAQGPRKRGVLEVFYTVESLPPAGEPAASGKPLIDATRVIRGGDWVKQEGTGELVFEKNELVDELSQAILNQLHREEMAISAEGADPVVEELGI